MTFYLKHIFIVVTLLYFLITLVIPVQTQRVLTLEDPKSFKFEKRFENPYADNWGRIEGTLKPPKEIEHWENLRIDQVNYIVNQQISYVLDYPIGAEAVDYWQTAEETYTLKLGDCEDYAILKMSILNRDHDVKLLLLVHREDGGGHGVAFIDNTYVLSNGVNHTMSINEIRKEYKLVAFIDENGTYWETFDDI